MRRRHARQNALLPMAVGLALLTACGTPSSPTPPPPRLVLATTTSTYDSGLLDYLLPKFEESAGLEVEVIAVGTGQALELGRNGDADVLLVHAPAQEKTFMAEGYGLDREAVMYNDFVVVGPEGDPAGISGMTDAATAFARIAAAEATFISRGDDSGTHIKEMAVWEAAGVNPQGGWYISAGQGMGAVLTMAEEIEAHTLSDRGTYLSRLDEGYGLRILVEGDPTLFNPYHAMAVNPELHPNVNYEGAQAFIAWITSLETQYQIDAFLHAPTGQQLFHPDSAEWRAATP